MKKLYILLLGIAVIWIAKLSYDVFKISEQQHNLVQITHQLEKSNSKLNDQLTALQRIELNQVKTIQSTTPILLTDHFNDLSQNLMKQQLLLIEFALKQQQPYYALEKLIELSRVIPTYPLSPELKQSLQQAINKDIDLIKQYIVRKTEQDEKIEKVLNKISLELKNESLNHHLVPDQQNNEYFWQKWFSINTATVPATELINRPLMMKEAQLRLLMARNLLMDGEYAQYQRELNEITDLLKPLPDQKTKQILAQIETLRSNTVIPQPTLNTRSLIG
ncbi:MULTISPECIES: hypothetical protein [unclassified Acinetobacter]|uniref:hypothetical protein n=1 Tax=unclassified Acinetobacter TaxID=196816 RepID=UPI0029345DF4|nr:MULTISPECIES: hypothetical protein [unclassified Acinetobacter]WOE30649.1 hypothetical protein QSG84_09695 [Acinetobacter sp. SAAs470]WOE38841.1 hypothetical protein QSG86_03360 [Acinetobacter sp. SAAs474]